MAKSKDSISGSQQRTPFLAVKWDISYQHSTGGWEFSAQLHFAATGGPALPTFFCVCHVLYGCSLFIVTASGYSIPPLCWMASPYYAHLVLYEPELYTPTPLTVCLCFIAWWMCWPILDIVLSTCLVYSHSEYLNIWATSWATGAHMTTVSQ